MSPRTFCNTEQPLRRGARPTRFFYVYLPVGAAQLDPIGIKRRLRCEKNALRVIRAPSVSIPSVYFAREASSSSAVLPGARVVTVNCAPSAPGRTSVPYWSVLSAVFFTVTARDSLKLIVASVLDKRAVNRSDPGKDDPSRDRRKARARRPRFRRSHRCPEFSCCRRYRTNPRRGAGVFEPSVLPA